MTRQTFRAVIEGRPGGGIEIHLPFDPNAAWGDKDRHYVRGAVEGRGMRGMLTATKDGFVLRLGRGLLG